MLVFDEVDTGIGGRSADPVGRSLWALARRHQVLCVTHLPQIAAHADAHYRIAKRERDGRTVTEIEHLDREGRIVELAQMLGGDAGGAGDPGQRARAPRPRRGLARRGRPGRLRPADACRTSTTAIDDYLTYLHVERGLAPATIRAYRADLRDFAASRGVGARLGGARPDAAVGYLAARTRRGRRGDPGLAPSSLRRRAAALKGFYRFAYGEGLIGVDVAAHLDLPRPSRLLPETLTVDETERLLEAAGGDDDRDEPPRATPSATEPCSSCSTPRACGSARRSASTARTSRSTARSCGSSARATRSGSCPVGDVALDWLGRWIDGPARRAPRARPRRAAPRRPALPRRSRRPAGPPAGVGRGQARGVAAPASPIGSARTRCATRSRRICSRAAPTCASSRSCSGMRVSPPRSSTRI